MVPSFIVKNLQNFQVITEIVAKNFMRWSFFKSFIEENEVGKIGQFPKKNSPVMGWGGLS